MVRCTVSRLNTGRHPKIADYVLLDLPDLISAPSGLQFLDYMEIVFGLILIVLVAQLVIWILRTRRRGDMYVQRSKQIQSFPPGHKSPAGKD